jgi:hypothetical protein
MPLGNPEPAYNWTAEYTASGIPWLTSSVLGAPEQRAFHFYALTKTIVIKNVSGSSNLKVGFTALGTQGSNNYILVPGDVLYANVRVTDMWLSGSGNQFSVLAELTGIPAKNSLLLTGSFPDGSGVDGVG